MASTQCGRVRVVARIGGQGNKDGEAVPVSKPWIVVSRPDPNLNNCNASRVKISFNSDQITSGKQSYEVDECYEQGVGNEEIFNREIKPLVSKLFGGQNSTVFAFGPRGSGKSHTLQGTEEDLGLSVLALDSILARAEEERKIVNISVFEVSQDRISDLLDSNRSEVLVFDDVHGKIKLKGLSKVKVNSTAEFQSLYSDAMSTRMQKATEPPHRSHIGCVIHVVSPQTESSSAGLVGKINFVDLASYEDSRRKSSDGSNMAETTRIKKSLTALHNVLYALNAKENRVPYRESKLTRMLQDSLGGMSKVLMVTCMNPSFCQETAQTISIASRSCIAGFLAYLEPGKSRSANKTTGKPSPQVLKSASNHAFKSSPQVPKSASKLSARTNLMSPKITMPISSSASARKHTGSLSSRKPSGSMAVVQTKGRKLFGETNQAKTPKMEKEKVCRVTAAQMRSSTKTEAVVSPVKETAENDSNLQEETSVVTVNSSTDSSQFPAENVISVTKDSADVNSSQHSLSDANSTQKTSDEVSEAPSEAVAIQVDNNDVSTTPCTYQTPMTKSGFLIEEKENRFNNGPSPPLSARLRELAVNMKSLCISAEANLKKSKDSSTLSDQVIHEEIEPKTPAFEPKAKANDQRYDLPNNASPWTSFHVRGSGVKDSLVQEYLKFVNSASKEELKRVKGIAEKRATYIIESREISPFKELDDLKEIGLTDKQIKEMMKNVVGDLLC